MAIEVYILQEAEISFFLNLGLECRNSALLRPIIKNFTEGHALGPAWRLSSFGASIRVSEKSPLFRSARADLLLSVERRENFFAYE